LSRHRGEVTSARYSPCGGKLATCDGNREVVVWDARSGEVIYDKAVFHKARVTAVAWSPDSRRLATGSLDGGVIVWDLAKPAMSGHVKIENAHAGGCACLEWKDENALVTGGFDACFKTWRVP
jgi:WD40 repeat protein